MATPPVSGPSGSVTHPAGTDPAAEDPALGPLYGLDIETDTSIDGLDPTAAAVVAVAVSSAERDVVLTGDESGLLSRLDQHLAGLAAGTLVTWNGASFDLPFLAERARRGGVPLGLRLWHRGADRGSDVDAEGLWPPPADGFCASWHGHRHLDGYRVVRADLRRTTGLSCGLKALARVVGLATVEVDRERLHLLPDDVVRAYVASDARLARELAARRLPGSSRWVDPPGPGSRGPVSSGASAGTARPD